MKDKLQQELLAKIKPGTKPSDLKKKSKKLSKTSQSPPIEISKDQGYESDSSDKSIPKAPPLPSKSFAASDYTSSKEVYRENFAAHADQNKKLLDQITALQKQLQLYKDFRESDLKIKEGYKQTIADLQQKITEQDKTIENLKTQAKTKENVKSEPTETKTFTCSDCNQEKPQSELSRVFNN